MIIVKKLIIQFYVIKQYNEKLFSNLEFIKVKSLIWKIKRLKFYLKYAFQTKLDNKSKAIKKVFQKIIINVIYTQLEFHVYLKIVIY